MNTSLKIIALSLAAALPTSIALSLAGATLPVGSNPLHILAAFVVTLVLLTIVGDYRRHPALAANASELQLRSVRRSRAEHPLAA